MSLCLEEVIIDDTEDSMRKPITKVRALIEVIGVRPANIILQNPETMLVAVQAHSNSEATYIIGAQDTGAFDEFIKKASENKTFSFNI